MSRSSNGGFRLEFVNGATQEAQTAMRERGSAAVTVHGQDGSRFDAFFVTLPHLQCSLDKADAKCPCLAEPNSFIVPEVTVEAVEASVEFLWREGYFRRYAMPCRPSWKRIGQMIVQFFLNRQVAGGRD